MLSTLFVTALMVLGVLGEPKKRPSSRQSSSSSSSAIITKCTVPGTVALTFDDGPYVYTSNLLDHLDAAGMKATFFLNGQNWDSITNYVEVVKRMHSKNHQIASHTWSHADLATLSVSEITQQMQELDRTLIGMIGVAPLYMRPPYLSTNPTALSTLHSLGYKVVHLDIDTKDYALQANINQAVANLEAGLNAGGSIVLAHDVHSNTVSGLAPRMIDVIRRRGLRAVTVGQCLGVSRPSRWYRTGTGTSPTTTSTLPGVTETPGPTSTPSPDGSCGGANRYVCPSGTCCSQWGWCGVEVGHCGAGCRPEFGVCT